ncbi:gas vesicle protein GvpP [Jeotgalibacillus sp. S-D1]|uniref:GvpT/GvpP family gas vesicle accessory protein n=1 Tax=Jeotgalibacillus sp. S-D1 TaxID=2552189 RepID=UPI001059B473|nr:GvpT/GvpP family gas vesicle accessory protein [Jeotgalibacillus sp. S-D1]TDL31902.1 gas vesicle protein GvpP [Jeotgalibacillus sp. S-D1]
MTAKKEETTKSEEKTGGGSSSSMNLAILGGVMGAGIGLLSSPGTSKKVLKSLGESEMMRIAGKELKRTAQEVITEQALNGLRQSATGYLSKGAMKAPGLLGAKLKGDSNKEENSADEEQSSQYDEIKEDNKNLNERLERIESMLSNLVESKKD